MAFQMQISEAQHFRVSFQRQILVMKAEHFRYILQLYIPEAHHSKWIFQNIRALNRDWYKRHSMDPLMKRLYVKLS